MYSTYIYIYIYIIYPDQLAKLSIGQIPPAVHPALCAQCGGLTTRSEHPGREQGLVKVWETAPAKL